MMASVFRSCAVLAIAATMILFVPACSRSRKADPEDKVASDKVADAKDSQESGVDPSFVPFNKAVRLDIPDGEQRPVDKTASGKVSAKLFEQIAGKEGAGGLWDQVKFVSPEGKRLKNFALLKTDAGDIKIELFYDAAPNHVRNFVCLAQAGFFDGLPFHQSIRRDRKGDFWGYLESGCPKGTGELGYGNIRYWLKPEISKTLKHEEGTVGAWHPEEFERAACRFYIALNKNPGWDGSYTIFGKVVHGLDVAHTINKRPVQDEEYKGPAQEPYRIRQVLIQQTFEDGTLVAADAL
jgi:cyclophilin family peptidyl-prolyl cis-trans isomerase